MEQRLNPAGLIARGGVLIIAAAIVLGPAFSHADYSSITHTVSELAGQNMPSAWIMRSGFAAFGAACALAAILTWRAAPVERSALALFGAGLIASAIWSHMHIIPALGGNLAQDTRHSFAAGVVGTGFAATMAAHLFWPGANRRDWLSWLGLIASVVLPLAMFNLPTLTGLLQRLMFAISFLWVWRAFPLRPARRLHRHRASG